MSLSFSRILQEYALFDLKINHYENLMYNVESLAKNHNFTIKEYYINLLQSKELKQELSERMCHHFSSFFRDNQHYLLLSNILPNFNNPRIWYVGCSTGEEAYSHSSFMHSNNINFKKLLATDISQQAIHSCQKATYHKDIINKNKQKKLLLGYLDKKDDSYYIFKNNIAKTISFKQHNLADDIYPSKFDIIICHNTLIYFNKDAKKAVAKKFWQSLNNGGILILGKNQSLFGLDLIKHFTFIKTINGPYYVKKLLSK